jgi:glyoxylase-like metal-dependent hydrolase (beta-lactamase superfamily II)/ferredoxin
MARFDDRLAENAVGDFFVDRTCIDCDLCRQIAPATFVRSDRHDQSYVERQPIDAATRQRALMALVTCPTASIGTTRKIDSRAAARAFPEPIADDVADVLFCGFASEDSYGASSWLIRRAGGNVLVDSPRWSSTLADRIDEEGGVAWMFLTHRDDVADHARWRDRFGCERVMHGDDRGRMPIERVIGGHRPVAIDDDLLAVPVPGHTRGSCALIYRDTFLFSGDHVWANDDEDGLECGRDVCWFSWNEQRASMRRLADHAFTWVVPGHGRKFRAASTAAMRDEVLRVAATM